MQDPITSQQKVLKDILTKASGTAFGKDHNFSSINNHQDFKSNVPVRDYEQLTPYVEKVVKGEKDILWPGKPEYFAKTSGTTSGIKYIPITKDSIPKQVSRWQPDLPFRKSGVESNSRNKYRKAIWHSQPPCALLPAVQPDAQLRDQLHGRLGGQSR